MQRDRSETCVTFARTQRSDRQKEALLPLIEERYVIDRAFDHFDHIWQCHPQRWIMPERVCCLALTHAPRGASPTGIPATKTVNWWCPAEILCSTWHRENHGEHHAGHRPRHRLSGPSVLRWVKLSILRYSRRPVSRASSRCRPNFPPNFFPVK